MTEADVAQIWTLLVREDASELLSREIAICHQQANQLSISLKIDHGATAAATGVDEATGPG